MNKNFRCIIPDCNKLLQFVSAKFNTSLRETAKKKKKKKSFFSGPATKALHPPPLGLVAIRNFFPYIKKSSSFLSGRALTPPLFLVAGPLKKITFFAASLTVRYRFPII